MINGSSLNQAAINAAAGVVLIQAAASFNAGATVVGEGTHEKAAFANILCGVQSIFGSTRTQYAFWNPVAGALTDLGSSRTLAASADWSSDLVIQLFSLNTVPAEAGFDATATMEALANAKLANADWTGDATWTAEPTKISSLDGDWEDINSGWLLTEGDRSAGAWGDWENSSQLWIEPTVNVGGVLEIEGYVFFENTATLENDPALTAEFLNGAWAFGSGDWDAQAIGEYGASGDWDQSIGLAMEGNRTFFLEMDLSAGVTIAAPAGVIRQSDQVNLSAVSFFNAAVLMKLAGEVDYTNASSLVMDSWTFAAGYGDWTDTSVLEMSAVRMAGTKIYWAAGSSELGAIAGKAANGAFDWSGAASSLSSAGVLKLVPAPRSRVFTLPTNKRTFRVPPRKRTYEVAA